MSKEQEKNYQLCVYTHLRKVNNNEELIVFNNLVNSIADYRNKWEIDIRLSWHKRYL